MTTTQIPDRSDGPAFRKYAAAVMASDGPWEFRACGTKEWIRTEAPWWNWENYTWRIAPTPTAPQWVPWTFETAPPIVKARTKAHGVKLHDVAILRETGFVFKGEHYSFGRALDQLEQLDGTPLGVKVEEEPAWPKWFVHVNGSNSGMHCVRFDSETSAGIVTPNTGGPDYTSKHWTSISQAENHVKNENWKPITAAEAAKLLAKGGQV